MDIDIDLGLVTRLEETEIAAYADFSRAPASVGSRLDYAGPIALLVCASTPGAFMMNRAIGAGLHGDLDDATIEQIKQTYLDAGAYDFGFQVAPIVLTDALAQRLEAHDFKRLDNWVRMVRGVTGRAEATTDLRVEVADRKYAAAFARISCDAFGLPAATYPLIEAGFDDPFARHYLAFDGDEPVATGTLIVRDGIGWLGNGATQPSHRRRGAQSAIMARRINDAIDAGCDLITTETGEETLPHDPNPSYHNMLRLGFELAYARPNFIYRPASASV